MDDYGYKTKRLIEGKGALFTNAEKWDEGSPDMKGELLYKGELIKIGGWIRHTDKGMLISLGIDKFKRNRDGY
jgi:hypothetical protein